MSQRLKHVIWGWFSNVTIFKDCTTHLLHASQHDCSEHLKFGCRQFGCISIKTDRIRSLLLQSRWLCDSQLLAPFCMSRAQRLQAKSAAGETTPFLLMHQGWGLASTAASWWRLHKFAPDCAFREIIEKRTLSAHFHVHFSGTALALFWFNSVWGALARCADPPNYSNTHNLFRLK